MANKLEELPIHTKALEFCAAVTAILERPAFGRNHKLRQQIVGAVDSIPSNMSEGFEQPTDAALEKYLFYAKGSVAEVLSRLTSAQRRNWLTLEELAPIQAMGEELGKMLGGWIRYLARCGWKDRGRHDLGKGPAPDPGKKPGTRQPKARSLTANREPE